MRLDGGGRAARPIRQCPASPVRVDAQTRVVRPRPASLALAWRAAVDQTSPGTSPSPVSLAEHHVLFGVGHELPDLLRAAAGHRDLGGPLQRLLP
jgi:hypothetical protein